jgi:hypothetical protein
LLGRQLGVDRNDCDGASLTHLYKQMRQQARRRFWKCKFIAILQANVEHVFRGACEGTASGRGKLGVLNGRDHGARPLKKPIHVIHPLKSSAYIIDKPATAISETD